jgi:outer membrane protein OmpA-like peptidoglycan-associated protein
MFRMFKYPFGLSLCLMLLTGGISAQQMDGRWAVGLGGGVNLWLNDLNKIKIGPGGQISFRYGVAPALSLGLTAGMEELKSAQEPLLTDFPYDYLKLNAFPVALSGWFHVSPGSTFAPYIRLGAGMMAYNRKAGGNPLAPDDNMRTVFIVPAGIGFEAFTSNNFAIGVDLGFTTLSDGVDLLTNGSADGYGTVRFGITWLPGSGDADDLDNDGLTGGQERRLGTDPNNPDSDGDGLGDGDELRLHRTNPLRSDSDSDGLTDGDEVNKYKTDPSRFDSDGDSLSDGDELQKFNSDPTRVDTDGDGLTDGDEILRLKTDPLKVDTDGDGLSDWDEVKSYRTDPANPDSDGDGIIDGEETSKYRTNPLKVDSDGGGLIDGAEVIRGTNPLNPSDDVFKDSIVLERGKTVILQGINFNSGSATLTRDSEDMLERAFGALVGNPTIRVEIAGYTDNVGSRIANERLSLRRAEAVRSWLVAKGIGASRLSVRGYGLRNPIDTNLTPDGRARNRRIEFHVR